MHEIDSIVYCENVQVPLIFWSVCCVLQSNGCCTPLQLNILNQYLLNMSHVVKKMSADFQKPSNMQTIIVDFFNWKNADIGFGHGDFVPILYFIFVISMTDINSVKHNI